MPRLTTHYVSVEPLPRMARSLSWQGWRSNSVVPSCEMICREAVVAAQFDQHGSCLLDLLRGAIWRMRWRARKLDPRVARTLDVARQTIVPLLLLGDLPRRPPIAGDCSRMECSMFVPPAASKQCNVRGIDETYQY